MYVVAADRDNAGIVYAAAKWMVEHSPALKKRSRIVDSTKTIYDTVSGSKLKVLSSEAYSKHGYKPSCVIFDELHAQPNRDPVGRYDVRRRRRARNACVDRADDGGRRSGPEEHRLGGPRKGAVHPAVPRGARARAIWTTALAADRVRPWPD